jgi:hypothetical protein
VQKTLEGVIYDALKNHLFVDNDKSASLKVKDINGEDRTKYTISYKDICDKVKDLVDGENDPLQSLDSTIDYDKVCTKCGERGVIYGKKQCHSCYFGFQKNKEVFLNHAEISYFT